MKRFVLALALLSLCVMPGFAKGGHGSSHSHKSSSSVVHVKEYRTKKGTVVHAHDRTRPNGTDLDNWSTKGNVNPETGKKGTKKHKH